MTKAPWSPGVYRSPMMGNIRPSFHPQMGIAPIVGIAVKWGLPWLLTAGGIAVAALATKEIFPDVPINKDKIGLAALLGGGGVTSYLVSDVIPESWRPVTYALAVAGVSSALYFLFTAPPAPPPPPISPEIPPEEVPIQYRVPGTYQNPYPPGWLAQMISVELDPAQTNTGGTWRNKHADQDYAVSLRNNSDRELWFYAGLHIRDDWGDPVKPPTDPLFPGGSSPAVPTVYGRQLVILKGGPVTSPERTKSIVLKAPALGGLTVTSYNTTVEIQLFRNYRDTQPFMSSPAISIQQVPPYYAPFG